MNTYNIKQNLNNIYVNININLNIYVILFIYYDICSIELLDLIPSAV